MYGKDDGFYLIGNAYLNDLDATAQGLLAGLAGMPGQLGKICAYDHALAAKLSKTYTLYGGLYQLVKFKASTTASNIRGQIVFWDTPTSYQVSPDATSALEGSIAGITLNSVGKGDYGIIQVGGLASVLYRAAVTDKTIGNIVLQLTTTNTADAIAESTGSYISGGVKGLKNIIGSAMEIPVDGGIARVWLNNIPLNI